MRSHAPLGLLGVLLALAAMEGVSRADILPHRWFPSATQTIRALVTEAGTAELWNAIADTVEGAALGLGIAALIGIPLGILIGLSDPLYRLTRALVEFLRPVPSVALIPLAVLLYGTELRSKLLLVVYAATWPLLVNVVYGVRDTDPVAIDTARAYRLGRLARIRHVTVPSTLPYLMTGVRLSASVSLILAVTAELVIGAPGLGQIIVQAQAANAVPLTYALIVVSGLLGLALNVLTRGVERYALRWHTSQRAGSRP
ncbi:MAG TPA: ABC transporter permease [Mycobacteriales bacterium]|nr:ABC transporter permease [Mycobacteriales bacterium]